MRGLIVLAIAVWLICFQAPSAQADCGCGKRRCSACEREREREREPCGCDDNGSCCHKGYYRLTTAHREDRDLLERRKEQEREREARERRACSGERRGDCEDCRRVLHKSRCRSGCEHCGRSSSKCGGCGKTTCGKAKCGSGKCGQRSADCGCKEDCSCGHGDACGCSQRDCGCDGCGRSDKFQRRRGAGTTFLRDRDE